MSSTRQKETGAYFTPPDVVSTLVKWAARRASDRLLDPSCGDGRFIALHRRSVGVEQEAESSQTARERAPGVLIHEGDFFTWAMRTTERFRVRCRKSSFHPISAILRQYPPGSTEPLLADRG